jgi:multiple sugar transport system permease protein
MVATILPFISGSRGTEPVGAESGDASHSVSRSVRTERRGLMHKLFDRKVNLWGYAFVLPALLLFLTFQTWPLIRGVSMAFSDYRWMVPETKGLLNFNGLDNYREMINDPEWRHSMWVTTRFTLGYLPVNWAIAMFVAVMISKVQSLRWSGFYRIVAYIPVVLPLAVAMLLMRNLYSVQYGYINHLLRTVFRADNPPNWLGDPKWALFSALVATLWKNFGYNTLLFLIGIYSINRELFEAASVDGANGWQQFWKIMLPLLRPILVLVLVLDGGMISATAEVMVLFKGGGFDPGGGTPGGPFDSALTSGLFSFRQAFSTSDMRMGYAASISLVLGLIRMLMSAVIFRALRPEKY